MSTGGDQEILYEVSDPVATITLNRPERMNALTSSLLSRFRECVDAAAADPEVVGIVLAGRGRAFCAGLAAPGLNAPPPASLPPLPPRRTVQKPPT